MNKDWYHAVKSYHEQSFRSAMSFLSSGNAKEFGLDLDDLRDFRRAVQTFDATWYAAVKLYIKGKFETPRKFVSSGMFLNLGFSPSMDHAEVLRFALKFYEEDATYRHNANSNDISALNKYGGRTKSCLNTTKTRTPQRVVGFDQHIITGDPDVPMLVDLSDDQSAESISRLSGDNSVADLDYICSFSKNNRKNFIQALLSELSCDRSNSNPIDGIFFFVFAVIPLVLFAQLWAVAHILLPFDFMWSKEEVVEELPYGIEDEWQKLRANALMVEEEYTGKSQHLYS